MRKRYVMILFAILIGLVGCSGNAAKDISNKAGAKEKVNHGTSQVVAIIDKMPVTEGDLQYSIFRHQLISKLHGESTSGPNTFTRASAFTDIIQVKAVAELAKLKGIVVTDAEKQSRIEKIKKEMEKSEVFNQEVKKYGEALFWKNEFKRYDYIIQSEKLIADIAAKKKIENPKGTEKEWNFDAMKDLDDIVYQQVDEMKIERKKKL